MFLNPVGSVFISEPCGPGSCGCPPPPGIIPAQDFLRIRMHFSAGNHLCKEISPNQDAFPRSESSLHSNFFESGCISLLRIIPAQKFLRIRMHFPAGNHPCTEFLRIRMHFLDENHPCQTFSSNQDAFFRSESSLHRIFFKSGCISPLRIIPTQKFLQIRMHFSAENHPYTEFSSNQDAFPR